MCAPELHCLNAAWRPSTRSCGLLGTLIMPTTTPACTATACSMAVQLHGQPRGLSQGLDLE